MVIILKAGFHEFRFKIDEELKFTFSVHLPEEVQTSKDSHEIHVGDIYLFIKCIMQYSYLIFSYPQDECTKSSISKTFKF